MKTIATITILLLSITCTFAFDGLNPDTANSKTIPATMSNGSNADLLLPWADNSPVNMDKVYSKDNYSLWRCESQHVTKFPGSNIKGKVYNYFVYKDNKFHMTVTEMNKNSVFAFFSK